MGAFIGVVALSLTLALPPDQSAIREAIGEIRYDRAVENLLIGVTSDNDGLRRSSAYMLGELKSEEAVIPLMRALKFHKDDCTRVVAALSLCKIGDARGVFAVKQEVRFNDSNKVRKCCAWFYNQYVEGGSFKFITPESASEILSAQ